MKRFAIALAGLLVVAAICAACLDVSAAGTPKKLRVIYTTELAGYIEPCG